MRHQGKLTDWQDDRGFGFITPEGGQARVFVHISAFAAARRRPLRGDRVRFALADDARGRRAVQAALLDDTRRSRRTSGPRGRHGPRAGPALGPALVLSAVFVALLALASLAGILPRQIPAAVFIGSAAAFAAYAHDKAAARSGRSRIRENTLHLLALAGGWPGALLAQQLLRHKSKKRAFRAVFWATVVANCSALGWLASPGGAALRQALGG